MMQLDRIAALTLATGLAACAPGVDEGPELEDVLDDDLDDADELRQGLVPPPGWSDEAALVYTEIVLVTGASGSPTRDSSRLFADPVIWFENWTGTTGEHEIRDYLEQGVIELTDRYVPHFVYDVVPPPDPANYIVVKFDPNNGYGQGWAVPPAPYGGVDHTGGRLIVDPCDPATNAFDCRAHEAHIRHELAHVLFGTGAHSGSRRSNMGFSGMLDPIDPLERAALNLHHSIPRGTSFEQLEQAGIITTAMLDAHRPRLERVADPAQVELGSAGERGDALQVQGSYLRYPYGRSRTPPSGWQEPTVTFTGASAVPIATGHAAHENNWVDVTVPPTAQSGPVTISSWSSTGSTRTSDPVYFHVRHPSLDATCASTYAADEGVYKDRDFVTRRYVGASKDQVAFSLQVDAGGAQGTSYDGDWDCFCFDRPWDPLQDGDWYATGLGSPDLLASGIDWGGDTCSYSGPGGDYLRNEAWCYSVLYAKTGGGTAACLDIH